MAGLEVDDVQIDGTTRGVPGVVRGRRPDASWVIVVHGNSMSRLDNVRWLPALHEAGYPTLTITYRNDGGAPEDPSGFSGTG